MFNKLKVGDQITLTGPYGEFFLREDTDAPIICIAGGSGSAPIRSIISYLREKNSSRKIISFYGGRTPRDIYFTDEYGELAGEMKDFTHIPAISEPAEGDGWSGEKGLITHVMDRHLKDLDGCEVYMCGPPVMIEFATKLLCERGMCPERIYYDKF
jgi:Na+-transporting NADH:ubiquinone oxidoreductase subunit F